jgi:uncharacterized protein YfaS (alpha-2-macroglobulin family)
MKNKLGVTLLIFYCLSAFSINLYQQRQTQKKKPAMDESFAGYWSKVDSLAKKGLNKSALETVMKIYEKAKAENNDIQILKAVIHRMKFSSFTEENNIQKSIADLKKECHESTFPASAIMHSMLAETYKGFYEQNRWKFMNRTETVDFNNEDINTWDLKKIFEQIVYEYRLSLDQKEKLERIQVNVFDDILEKGNTTEARNFRPTLYDFLAHRALDFYMNDESGLTQPVSKYKIDAAWYLNDVEMFLNFGLKKEDSLDTKYNAIVVLQELLRLHQDDQHPGAIIDVNLKRLKFVYNELTIPVKDSLYLNALQKIASRYKDFPGSTDALYEIASVYLNKGSDYQPGDNEDIRMMKRKAELVCDTAIERFPHSQGGENCRHLKAVINEKSISFQAEKVNVPGKPFLGCIKYTNVNKVFVRVSKMDAKTDEELSGLYGERLVKYYLSLPKIKEWSFNVPDDGDKQTHSAEFRIPELEFGKYMILVSGSEQFSYDKNMIAYSPVYISDLSSINRRNKGGYDIYVLNRTTGEPEKDVLVTRYSSQYNYTSRKYETKKGTSVISNEEGFLRFEGDAEQRNFSLELLKGNDRLFLNDNLHTFQNQNESVTQLSTYFFTDRSIYRPGQTVYFKGIVLETDSNGSRIRKNFKSNVEFFDVNSQKISGLQLTTNEYGTFNGSFTAPQGLLTGMMRIQNENGSRYFSVEEYKRPKFEVTFLPVQGSYMVNNRITVNGNVKSYSGAAVSEGKLTYNVSRTARIPEWYYSWKSSWPRGIETVISNGTMVTDSAGNFSITFDAVADEKLPKESNPVFNFKVNADVTDINGETRSGEINISAGYQALFIETDVKENLNSETWDSILIQSRNMAGNFEGAKGKISIYKLMQPEKNFRTRLWEMPDRHTMSKEEFQKDFPNDIFENENDPVTWKKGEQILNASFDTEKDSTIDIPDEVQTLQGSFVLEINSKDKFGNDVKYLKYFTLYSRKSKKVPVSSFFSVIPVKTTGEPGEKAQFLVGSSDKNAKILFEVEHDDRIVSNEWIRLDDNQQMLEIPITETYRGNFSLHFTMVKQNRIYKADPTVTVPWSNKEIKITMETFRNKLLPGSKEEWRLKLTGKFSDKIAAEFLAGMYDASLDAFQPHRWDLDIWGSDFPSLGFETGSMFSPVSSAIFSKERNQIPPLKFRTYDALNWFGYDPGSHFFPEGMQMYSVQMSTRGSLSTKEEEVDGNAPSGQDELKKNKSTWADSGGVAASGANRQPAPAVQPRKNFNETAFFYPSLVTNEKNEVIFSFTMPDALTRWKFMGLAHTQNLEYGFIEKEVITQKELMIVPNPPRFLREGDTIEFPCKITNLSDTSIDGVASLTLYDALTNANITSQMLTGDSSLKFTSIKGGNATAAWKLVVPTGFSVVKYKVVAVAKNFSDGEEQAIPVLTNRMLVTESLPLWVNSGQQKNFTLDKLKNNTSTTLQHHKLTLEFTSNPAWYAIQALPYLMEFPYECSEQVFSRYYSNALASHIANSSEKIKAVFDAWKNQSPENFLSSLEKNQDLKLLLLQQTPWVLDAQNESERKKRIALLFDMNKMSNDLQSSLLKLQKKQNSDGSWSWFEGMPDDRYITQYIVEGFGHLDHLGVQAVRENEITWNMVQRALSYLDRRIDDDYRQLVSSKADLSKNNLSQLQVHYLYARSFFKSVPVENAFSKAFNYYLSQEKKFWLENRNEMMQAMISLTLARYDEKTTALDVIKSLKENSQYSEELGRYWKNNTGGYYWSHASIETQSLLIEAFHDVAADKQAVDEMQRWLLKNKQTNDWKTTKATAEACYALLLQGTDFLATTIQTDITVGNKKLNPTADPETKVEAGTGYFKTSWNAGDIQPEMAKVKLKNNNQVPAWGALYWQYFEQLDKITMHETPLKIEKRLFIEQNSESGKVIIPVSDSIKIKTGDRIKVRIELRVDRDMEYVMMQDMRASGLEPENVISSYKWQDGLGYYESTHDASTDFFFSFLTKGTYVFEYPLRAFQEGNFSNGITSIQCMYAPEFGAHSAGTRIRIGEK